MQRQLTAARAAMPLAMGLVALGVAVLWRPFPAPLGVLVSGSLSGGRIALIALGIALIWRTNRVISFAQADLGGAPAMLAVLLVVGGLMGWILAKVGYGVAGPKYTAKAHN